MGGGKITFSDRQSALYVGINYSYPVRCVLDIYGGELKVCGKVNLNRGAKIHIYKGATLAIGNNSYINEGAKVYCAKNITIGSDCAIAFDTKILDTDTHFIFKDENMINENREVIIGNNVWVGANSFILKGTHIDNNVIIGACSLVSANLNSNKIYVGTPAKEVKSFDRWGYKV